MNNRCTEDYAWVDELLEKKYYGYISEDQDDSDRDYETFAEEERYAWVDELLEKKYYGYISEDEDNIKRDYHTFSDDDCDVLIRDLKTLIAYHEDRRQRRNNQTDEVFALFNQLTANAQI